MKNSMSADKALRDALAFQALAEGFLTPDEAWRGRYAALQEEAREVGVDLPAPPQTLEQVQGEYHAWFGPAPACPLEIGFHLSSNPFEQAKVMAHLAGFGRAFGVECVDGERPDALPVLFSFAAFLVLKHRQAEEDRNAENAEVTSSAMGDFVKEYLGPGLAAFGIKARELGMGGFYKQLLIGAETLLKDLLNMPAGEMRPSKYTMPAAEEAEGEMTCGALPQ